MGPSAPNEPHDSEIVERIRSGDVNAFELLLDRYRGLVCAIAIRHIPRESIEEVVHDSFVRAYQSLGSYAAKGPFGHWLSKVAVRCCHDFWRDRYRRPEASLTAITDDHRNWLDAVLAAESRDAFNRETSRREAAEVLKYALDGLSPEDRMALTLVYLDDMPVREAADLLGWSVVKLKVRAHRARRRMRKIISDLMKGKGER